MSEPKTPKSPRATIEQRSERLVVSPFEVAGRLKLPASEAEIMLIWNVSDQGLCVWTTSKLARGEVVVFEMEKPWRLSVRSEVRWCRSVPDRSGFLIGLLALDHRDELLRLHDILSGKTPRAG